MSYLSHVELATSGARSATTSGPWPAAGDGDHPVARYDLVRARAELDRDRLVEGPASLWRYAGLLPVADPEAIVSLGEGWTPLLDLPTFQRRLGCRRLLLKDEGRNPTGAFKDRGASVALSRYRELGVRAVVHNSSGNAAAAWSLYGARAGIQVTNIVPDDILPASLLQSSLAGARVDVLDGLWTRSGAAATGLSERHGWTLTSTLREPWRIEGKKTMAFELCEQLGWQVPDVIVYPVGGGLGPIAMYKGFEELATLGWIPAAARPRLVVTQYRGCAPVVRAFENGQAQAETWHDPDVPPGGLKAVRPPGDRAVLQLLRDTAGAAYAVSTEQALDAAARLARCEGIFACPESATVLVGLERAVAEGTVGPDDVVVLMCTGTGLKSVPNFPLPVPCRMRAPG